MQTFIGMLRSLLTKEELDYFDCDPLCYTLRHYGKVEEFEFLVKTQVKFGTEKSTWLSSYSYFLRNGFTLTQLCHYSRCNMVAKQLELLIQNWHQRYVPLQVEGLEEECIIAAFFNQVSAHKLIEILLQNAEKIGINPNPKLGNRSILLFNVAFDRFGADTSKFDPKKCEGWSFLQFAKRLKLKRIVDLYKTYST